MSSRERRWYRFCCPLMAALALYGGCKRDTGIDPQPTETYREQPTQDSDAGHPEPPPSGEAGQAGAQEAAGAPADAVDLCATANGGCDKLVACSTSQGVARCGACPRGYDDAHGDGTECRDIDECAKDRGGCDAAHGECANNPGGRTCSCKPGYRLDGTRCLDVDECASSTRGGCEQICVNAEGTHRCACEAGALPAPDGKNCWSWHAATRVPLEVGGIDRYSFTLALNTEEYGLGAWLQSESSATNAVYVSRIREGKWQPAEKLGAEGHRKLALAINAGGDGVAAWSSGPNQGAGEHVFASSAKAGGAWAPAQRLDGENPGAATFPDLAIDRAGDAIAVWQQYYPGDLPDTLTDDVWASRYVAASGWGTAEKISAGEGVVTAFPVLAINESGHGIAVWSEADGTRSTIRANRRAGEAGWMGAMSLPAQTGNAVAGAQLALDRSGNALATWIVEDAPNETSVWASHFRATYAVWSDAKQLAGTGAYDPHVALGDSGFVTWGQSGSAAQEKAAEHGYFAARFHADSGFEGAKAFAAEDKRQVIEHSTAVDGSRAVAIWLQSAGYSGGPGYTIWASSYDAAPGWSPPVKIVDAPDGFASRLKVVALRDGHARAFWVADAAIWTAVFD